VIKTKTQYNRALKRSVAIFQVEPGTSEFDELELLLVLIKEYEDKHIALPEVDPIGATRLKTEERGKDLNKSKLPVVRIDNTLEKYKDKVLFMNKSDNANEMLKTVRLPKSSKQHS
jgi:antitoxin component HigA of HigAB toxin-antitoxin module